MILAGNTEEAMDIINEDVAEGWQWYLWNFLSSNWETYQEVLLVGCVILYWAERENFKMCPSFSMFMESGADDCLFKASPKSEQKNFLFAWLKKSSEKFILTLVLVVA